VCAPTPHDDEVKKKISVLLTKMANRDRCDSVMAMWKQQILDSFEIPLEEGEETPSMPAKILHYIVLPWKFIFSLCPPTTWGGGWVAFFVALIMIAMVTIFIGDLATYLGCVIGIPDGITAITIVGVGTSLPDTFASMRAAKMDKTADNSVGNVTGSNCVNVFLGLGLPWMIASFYWTMMTYTTSSSAIDTWKCKYTPIAGSDKFNVFESTASYVPSINPLTGKYTSNPNLVFVVPQGSLIVGVIVFCICAVICMLILQSRRIRFGGELGGPMGPKKATAAAFVGLWGMYLLFSILADSKIHAITLRGPTTT
jgi:Ca2+/Na+ antiporter